MIKQVQTALKISLDTNIWKGISQNDSRVIEAIGQADKIFISFIVHAELLYGFKSGSRFEKNVTILNRFLRSPEVELVHSTNETIEIYSEIAKELRQIGKPIPSNDIWISALAIETGSSLLTFDKHFSYVPGLRLILKN